MFIINAMYPTRCPGCDEIMPYSDKKKGFCKRCAKEVYFTGDKVCMKCGQPINSSYQEYCSDCGSKNHQFTQGKALFSYKGVLKPAMYRFKYSNRRCYAKIFSKLMVARYGNWIRSTGANVIIPIPMYDRKKRLRGYNQAEVMGKAFAKEMGLAYRDDVVVRTCDTQPMKLLNDVERKYNLQNAFKLSDKGVNFNKVILIDDIYTTGSTMDQVSRVLKEVGVRDIFCISICIGDNTQEVR